MSNSATVHAPVSTHLRAALRRPMGLGMLIVMLLAAMVVAMLLLTA